VGAIDLRVEISILNKIKTSTRSRAFALAAGQQRWSAHHVLIANSQ